MWMENHCNNNRDDKSLSVLMMDIDNFKEYNDTYGHIKGDEVIRAVTETINRLVRKGDIFARYGGEEFVLILNDVTEALAVQIAEKLRVAIEALEIEHKRSPYNIITLSFGVFTMPPETGLDVQQFVNCADLALYEAKSNGRNTVFLHTSKIEEKKNL